ncbi:polysaccharide deacetylase family protein [Cellulosimicrobium sp. NPDC055967]|uniref:polysaccharide deacetylase family protein n=1 Tax=Cellulosimicrobium sp. NPDC055967 TaxID=3345670 RepID=UPI0035D81BE0
MIRGSASLGRFRPTGRRWSVPVRRHVLDEPASREAAPADRAIVPFPVPSALLADCGVFCVETTERRVALTFDDGPSPDGTPGVLEALGSHGARATFFVLVSQVEAHLDLARRIVDEGHEVALHGTGHESLLGYDDHEGPRVVTAARERLEELLGVRVDAYRPPYGHHTARQARRIRRSGLEVVLWSADARDWLHDDEEVIARRALAEIRPGGILLLHDHRGDPETLRPDEELPHFDRGRVTDLILAGLAVSGYTTATVGELLTSHRVVRSRSAHRRTSA